MYSVGNFLELLTVTSAWYIYEQLWGVLVSTGIAYVPFAALIASGVRATYTRMSSRVWPIAALYFIEWRLYTAFFVVAFVLVPSVGVSQQEMIHASNSCTLTRSDVKREKAQSKHKEVRFEEVRMNDQTIKVPLWWWLLNNVGQGLTAVGINALPCKIDSRQLAAELFEVAAKNPELNHEMQRFQKECWHKAYQKLLQTDRKIQRAAPSGRNHTQDIAWSGSDYFLYVEGYYNNLYPEQAVRAFPYELGRDEIFANSTYASAGGWPTCKQWWGSDQYGLRSRLLESVGQPFLAKWFQRFQRTPLAEDELLYELLSAQRDSGSRVAIDNLSANNFSSVVVGLGQTLLGGYSAVSSSPELSALFKVLRDSAPIVQSVVLLVIIIALPFALLAGGYSIDRTIKFSLVFLSVVFWGFLFKLIYWIDSTLSDLLFPLGFANPISLPTQFVFSGVMFGLYFSLPVLFTRWAVHAGGDVGAGIGDTLASMGRWQTSSGHHASIGGSKGG